MNSWFKLIELLSKSNWKLFYVGAYVDLKSVKKSNTASAAAPSTSPASSVALNSDAVFKAISERINENIEKAKAVNGIFLYNITKDGQIVKKWSKFSTV